MWTGTTWVPVKGTGSFAWDGSPAETYRAVWPLPLDRAIVLGDAWERGYGDLEWRGLDPVRVLPWVALVKTPDRLYGFGVRTGADAMVSWRIDGSWLWMFADLRALGSPLTGRDRIDVGELVFTEGEGDAYEFARSFCQELCPSPRLPSEPVWGINDWYYAYGASTAETIQRDTGTLMELAPSDGSRPFSVIDMGWARGYPPSHGGPQDGANDKFGDMARVADRIRASGARPGIWYRPLATTEDDGLPRLPGRTTEVPGMTVRDPSAPETLARIAEEVRTLREWGYDLIKHDFTTNDLTGRWGFEMDARVGDAVRPADATKTTAQILKTLYATIREAAGDALLIGCNTVGHLTAGTHEISRTGDDTSGREWSRTVKMGPNTLAMRMAQHGTFHAADADCVAFTGRVPEQLDLRWLDLVSRSGTPLFVSASPEGLTPKVREALREAYARAAVPRQPSVPLDWLKTVAPRRWRHADGDAAYDWSEFA